MNGETGGPKVASGGSEPAGRRTTVDLGRQQRLASRAAILALLLWPVAAVAQSSPPISDASGLDFFRPPENLFQLEYEYRTAPGSTRDVTTQTLNFRYDHAFYLTPTWTVVTRADLPLLARNTINSGNPNGNYLYGIGDADIQAAVIHDLDKRWAVGFGARMFVPTGEDPLGSGKWRVMPIMGFRVALPEISSSSYFEPIFRYDVSVAGDPTRRNISNLQFGPALNIGLPDRWSVTFYPSQDIRFNFGDPITGQTGRLFLPFDVRVGKKIDDHVAASFEVGVPIIKDYPVYNFKGQFRLNVTW
ncbi:transporter [Bradyrhizobium sp. S3.2.12]|uniref:transporter n=1 Tax=Bradyrhizobium sp. S3.2.12 TaxID=3156387 RepID=UPI003396D7F0